MFKLLYLEDDETPVAQFLYGLRQALGTATPPHIEILFPSTLQKHELGRMVREAAQELGFEIRMDHSIFPIGERDPGLIARTIASIARDGLELIVLDLQLNPLNNPAKRSRWGSGLSVAGYLSEMCPDLPVVWLTRHSDQVLNDDEQLASLMRHYLTQDVTELSYPRTMVVKKGDGLSEWTEVGKKILGFLGCVEKDEKRAKEIADEASAEALADLWRALTRAAPSKKPSTHLGHAFADWQGADTGDNGIWRSYQSEVGLMPIGDHRSSATRFGKWLHLADLDQYLIHLHQDPRKEGFAFQWLLDQRLWGLPLSQLTELIQSCADGEGCLEFHLSINALVADWRMIDATAELPCVGPLARRDLRCVLVEALRNATRKSTDHTAYIDASIQKIGSVPGLVLTVASKMEEEIDWFDFLTSDLHSIHIAAAAVKQMDGLGQRRDARQGRASFRAMIVEDRELAIPPSNPDWPTDRVDQYPLWQPEDRPLNWLHNEQRPDALLPAWLARGVWFVYQLGLPLMKRSKS